MSGNFTLYRNEGHCHALPCIVSKKSALFTDQPVSHLCFWGLPLVYFLESGSQTGDCISWWKASLSAMLRLCINSVKSHSVSQTPQSELVLYQCCSQGWAWLNFLKQMTLFWKVFLLLTKPQWIIADWFCSVMSSLLNLIWPWYDCEVCHEGSRLYY